MMEHVRRGLLMVGVAVLIAPVGTLAQPMMGGMPGGGSTGPTEVGVVTIARQQVPFTSTLPGRVAASKIAEIRPQVGGVVESVDFKEGYRVEAGDLLYQLQSDGYQASLAAAKASLQRAQATASNARDTVARYEKLAGTVSQTDLDNAKLAFLQAEADVAAAQANVTSAQINLDHTRITAPLSGEIGLSSVNQGALVTANQSAALATIHKLDPVYIDLVDSSANLLKLRKAMQDGTLSGNGNKGTKVTLILEDGSTYNQTGSVSQADVVVSETTGTFEVRATIANPDRTLLPGMFVRAVVELGNETAFLVPQRAVTYNSDGKATVLVVSDDNTAKAHVLETSRAYGNSWVVTSGIDEGDQIIVDGLQKISEGSEVSPLPVEINEDGVILQTLSASDGAVSDSGGAAEAPDAKPQGDAQ